MISIGITGGIGSGKSHVCRLIRQEYGFPVFYTDDEAKQIIRTDAKVRHELCTLVGQHLYDADGSLVKSVLAAYLCQGQAHAARVNAIVHPRVAAAFRQWQAQQTAALVIMECALLFESGFDALVTHSLCVTCDNEVRISRVMQRDNVSREAVCHWIALQMPDDERRRRATFTLDTTSGCQEEIIEQLAHVIKQLS